MLDEDVIYSQRPSRGPTTSRGERPDPDLDLDMGRWQSSVCVVILLSLVLILYEAVTHSKNDMNISMYAMDVQKTT